MKIGQDPLPTFSVYHISSKKHSYYNPNPLDYENFQLTKDNLISEDKMCVSFLTFNLLNPKGLKKRCNRFNSIID
jgi:hypothetical protein